MMMFFPDLLRTKVKSRLRDLRFVARELRATTHDRDAGQPAGEGGLVGAVADLSDTALSAIEQVAIGLLSSDPKAHFERAPAYPLERYFAGDPAAAKTRFARDLYFAAKKILLAKGFANPRVSEEIFDDAHGHALEALGGSPSGGREPKLDEIGREAAAMAVAVLRARPVLAPRQFLDTAEGRTLDANLYVAAALALGSAVASFHDDLTPQDEVYESVCAAVDVRYRQIEAAALGNDPAGELARIFSDLIPHLP